MGIVWAPDSVRASLEEPVRPRIGPAGILLMVVGGCAFTWVPAFAVFALTGAVAPSVTGGAGVSEIALWALLFAVLTGIIEGVTALIGKLHDRHRAREAASARRSLSRRRMSERLNRVRLPYSATGLRFA